MSGLAAAVERLNFLRLPSSDVAHREWLHFVIHDANVDLVLNFSVLGSPAGGTSGNMLLLARLRDGEWEGDVERFPGTSVRGGRGRLWLDLGPSSLRFDGAFRARAICRRRDISAEITLEPLAVPYLVHGSHNVQWLVAPRWRATGELRIRGRCHRIDGAPAYHDHNWGDFEGGDVAWRWGSTLAPEGYQAIFVQLLDRANTATLAQGLFLWNGAHRERSFRGAEVSCVAEGLLRKDRCVSIPRSLSLLASTTATDVPERLLIRAREGADHLEGRIECSDLARVLVPRDVDLGVTVIHEIKARCILDGKIAGADVHIDAPAFAETLGWLG